MLIDWFTVSAQALNFLILVWLMKRFLYKPILNAIETREKLITAELADAEAKRNDAKRERDQFTHKNEELDKKRASLLNEAREEAKAERQNLFAVARQEADALLAKRQEALRVDAYNLNHSINIRAKQEVLSIVRKMLFELATESLEERIREVFIRRLRQMDVHAKETMAKAFGTTTSSAIIRSAFDLTVDQRATIQNALNETFLADIPVKYEINPDLISGIELLVNGQSLAWSIADYLSSLEKDITELLEDIAKQKDKVKSASKTEDIAQTRSKNSQPKVHQQ